jgi:hypothetical protein
LSAPKAESPKRPKGLGTIKYCPTHNASWIIKRKLVIIFHLSVYFTGIFTLGDTNGNTLGLSLRAPGGVVQGSKKGLDKE